MEDIYLSLPMLTLLAVTPLILQCLISIMVCPLPSEKDNLCECSYVLGLEMFVGAPTNSLQRLKHAVLRGI